MSETTTGVLAGYRNTVIELLQAGESFDQVEEAIDGIAELSEDQRAALWLLAFSKRDVAVRQRAPHLFSVN